MENKSNLGYDKRMTWQFNERHMIFCIVIYIRLVIGVSYIRIKNNMIQMHLTFTLQTNSFVVNA